MFGHKTGARLDAYEARIRQAKKQQYVPPPAHILGDDVHPMLLAGWFMDNFIDRVVLMEPVIDPRDQTTEPFTERREAVKLDRQYRPEIVMQDFFQGAVREEILSEAIYFLQKYDPLWTILSDSNPYEHLPKWRAVIAAHKKARDTAAAAENAALQVKEAQIAGLGHNQPPGLPKEWEQRLDELGRQVRGMARALKKELLQTTQLKERLAVMETLLQELARQKPGLLSKIMDGIVKEAVGEGMKGVKDLDVFEDFLGKVLLLGKAVRELIEAIMKNI